MMKMVIVSPRILGGGAEKVAVNLANYFCKEGNAVTLLVFNRRGEKSRSELLNKNVQVVSINSRTRYAFIKCVLILRRIAPDRVISVFRDTNLVVGFCRIFLRFDAIFREANTFEAFGDMSQVKRTIYLTLMRIAYSKSRKVIANSEATKLDLLKYQVVEPSKIQVVGNPVIADSFAEKIHANLRHKWLDNSDCIAILAVGRLEKQKNFSLLIEAFSLIIKTHPTARLIIVGQGNEESTLLSLIRNKNISEFVDIVPFVSNPLPYFRGADVFVLSSLWEGFGNVIIEAMAARTIVVSTDCPGAPRYLLDDGSFGILVPSKSIQSLADGIVQGIARRAELALLDRAESRAHEFSVSRIAKIYVS